MPSIILMIVLLTGSMSAWGNPAPPAGPVALPASIHKTLDEEYPGWKYSPVADQIQIEFKKHKANLSPSIVSDDFNHDGKRDYAVQIVFTAPDQPDQIVTEQIVILFLSQNDGYQETILQTGGLDRSVYLWDMKSKSALMILGGPVGDTTYAYVDGKMQEIESTPTEEASTP